MLLKIIYRNILNKCYYENVTKNKKYCNISVKASQNYIFLIIFYLKSICKFRIKGMSSLTYCKPTLFSVIIFLGLPQSIGPKGGP